jgi:hypothetical protein
MLTVQQRGNLVMPSAIELYCEECGRRCTLLLPLLPPLPQLLSRTPGHSMCSQALIVCAVMVGKVLGGARTRRAAPAQHAATRSLPAAVAAPPGRCCVTHIFSDGSCLAAAVLMGAGWQLLCDGSCLAAALLMGAAWQLLC